MRSLAHSPVCGDLAKTTRGKWHGKSSSTPDPGQDDAVAILLALSSPEVEVLGITTVAGVPLALTTRNARQIVELSGRPVPIHAGADRLLNRKLVTAEYVHGKTGLDGIALPGSESRWRVMMASASSSKPFGPSRPAP